MKYILFVLICFTLQGKEPNIILIMADDQGWKDVSYYNHPHLKTPNIDKLAKEGVILDRFYAAAPTCSPTRGSVLTGRHPHRYGINHANVGFLKRQEVTLAELLKKKGYSTGLFGKWHLGSLSKNEKLNHNTRMKYSPPWLHGFDTCFATEAKVPTWDPMIIRKDEKSTKYWNEILPDEEKVSYNTYYWTGKKKQVDAKNVVGCDSENIMDRAISFIQKNSKDDKPFFAVIWFHAPHWPVVAGKKYKDMYKKHGDFKANYWGSITALDEQVGRLRRFLEKQNILDNTMICYTSDNGPEGVSEQKHKLYGVGDAGSFKGRKRTLFEGGIRVPSVIYYPKKFKPRRISTVSSTLDYFPTILDLVGIENKNLKLDGISLIPFLKGEERVRKAPLGFLSDWGKAWIVGNFKLIIKKDEVLLFNIRKDITEKKNRASSKKDKVEEMKKALELWEKSVIESSKGNDYK